MRPRITPEEYNFLINRRLSKESNVLVIGDLHEPFCLDSYLDFNINLYNKYNCNKVVFIGDVIDNHFSSYHETNPDGLSASDELELAIKRIGRWRDAFPVAHVTIGNHDRLIMRKARSGAISSRWIKSYSEVLETPKWEFVESVIIDGVLYEHGEAATASTRVNHELQSVVQGHRHSEAYIKWVVGASRRAFGAQVGCGIDRKKYAFDYAKAGKKPIIGSCVVLDNGSTPILELMVL